MVLKRKHVAQEGNYLSPEEQLTESMNIIENNWPSQRFLP